MNKEMDTTKFNRILVVDDTTANLKFFPDQKQMIQKALAYMLDDSSAPKPSLSKSKRPISGLSLKHGAKTIVAPIYGCSPHPQCPMNRFDIRPRSPKRIRMVAKMGEYQGRKSDGPPEPQTLWRGLQRLEYAAEMLEKSILKLEMFRWSKNQPMKN